LSKPILSRSIGPSKELGPQELWEFVRFHLGLGNRPRAKLYAYKIKSDSLILSRVEMDEILTLKDGGGVNA